MGSNCVSAPKCRCRPAKKKRPLCCSDSATSTPVPTGKQNNFTAVWSKLFTCVIITFLLCLLNYMGNVSPTPSLRRPDNRAPEGGEIKCFTGRYESMMLTIECFDSK